MPPGLIILIIAVVLGGGGYAMFAMRKRRDEVSQRLDLYTEGVTEKPSKKKKDGQTTSALTDRFDKALAKRGFAENLRIKLARANLKLTVGEFVAAQIICVFLFAIVAYVLKKNPFLSLIGAGAGFFAPQMYLGQLQSKRLKMFNNQLGDTINLLVNSIRSGYSVLQAMETVAKEMGAPISEEFDRVVREVQLGLSMEQALDNMLRRVSSDDLDLLITAINVQREVGGNLAEVLDSISFTIRERVRIIGEIRALTAQARGSGIMISLMPVALTFFIYLINPDFVMQLVEDKCGWCMIGVAVGGIVIGFIVIQKIVDIKV